MEPFISITTTTMRTSSLLILGLLACATHAQNVGINTTGAAPAASAMLDIVSTNSGLLIPRVALTATNAAGPVTAPATALLVYNTATAGTSPNNVVPGFYYWTGTAWTRMFSAGDGWRTIGNAGTVATTNFIGTTDAVAFVTKTGGAAATNERIRVLATGQVVHNNTGFFTGDVFSVYSNNTTNGTTASITNTLGTFAINGYASGSGTALYGEVNGGTNSQATVVLADLYGTSTLAASTSEAVWGINGTAALGTGATASSAIAVRGDATGAAGSASTMGIAGLNSGTAGSAYGVYGQNASSAAPAVFGINTLTTGFATTGVQGQAAGTAGGSGLRGFGTAAAIGAGQSTFGVRGSTTVAPTGTGFATGVRGDATGGTGTNFGVYGQVASATGYGMDAVNTNTAGTALLAIGNNAAGTFLVTGSGAALNGNGVGALAIAKTAASGVGLVGVGNNLTTAIITPASGCGVAGTGTQFGVMGYATTTVSTDPVNNAATAGANASSGGYFEVQSGGVAQTWSYVGVQDNGGVLRKIIGPGTVNTIVQDTEGNRVALSCPEAPENLFQDYGAGRLVNGRAQIVIDPIFAKNIVVNEAHPLRVFVQLEGDCKGVYVTNKTASGFDVVELDGGTSDIPFTYSIVANRADELNADGSLARYSEERFPPAPGPQPTVLQPGQEVDDRAARDQAQPKVAEAAPGLDKLKGTRKR